MTPEAMRVAIAEACGAEMRSILEHAVWHEWSEYNGASHYQLNNVDRCSVTHALSTQCGVGWLSPEKAGRLREALKEIQGHPDAAHTTIIEIATNALAETGGEK